MTWTQERARVASLTRSRPDNDPDLEQARLRMRVARFEMDLQRLIRTAPQLTDGERARIVRMVEEKV